MPNKASRAGHIPQRTCVICKLKQAKVELLRFIIADHEAVFDLAKKIPGRGHYVCDKNVCLKKMDKWLKKRFLKNKK